MVILFYFIFNFSSKILIKKIQLMIDKYLKKFFFQKNLTNVDEKTLFE